MAVAGTLLGTATADTSNTTIYATGLVTPTANALILVLVASSKTTDPDVPTLAGNGLTYVQVATVAVSAIRRVTVFRGMGATPVLGAITATFANNQTGCIIHVCQFTGTDTSGTNGSGAVVQSVTNSGAGVTDLTVTLAALGSANNAAFGAFVGTDVLTAGGAFTSLGSSAYATPTAEGETEWALNQTAVFCDIAGTKDIAGVAVEVKAASLGQTVGAMAALGTATFPTPQVNLVFSVAALGTAATSSPTVARGAVSIAPAALGTATFPAPQLNLRTTPAVLGTATVPSPTIAAGAVAIVPAALGTATLPAPAVAPGAVAVAPEALGTASIAEPKLNLAFGVALLGGGASLGSLTIINRQLVSPTAALGTASLGSPQLNLSLTVPALGPASVGTPVLAAGAAALSPAALGTASLPALVVAPGAVSIAPALLGTASVVAPALAYVIAPAALGTATLPALIVLPGAVAITPAVLGTASVVAPILTVPQTIGPFAALGGATIPAPALPVLINFTSAGTPFASTLNQASYSTASWTPTANVLVLVAVGNSQGTAATVPTLTGNGLTWDQVATVATPALSPRVTVFRAWTGASPTTGALTADYGGTTQTACIIHISEATGTSGAAANGGLAIAQSATGASDAVANPSITLGTFGQASNGTYGAFRGGANPAAGAGFTALAESTHNSPTGYLLTEWRTDNDTSVNTVTASSNFAGIALEIQNIIVPGAIGPMAALGPASLVAPGIVQTVAVAALGPATVGAPQVNLAALIDVLGGATLAEPTFALGAITAVIDNALGGASVLEPVVVEGQTLIGPFAALGGAATAEPILLATSVLDALGGAALVAFNVELRFYPALLGGATNASLEILAAPPPFDIPALGEATLPNISLVMLVDVEVLGVASLGVPLMGAYVQPDILGTASLPDLVVAAGSVIIEADPLGGASLESPLLHQSIGAFDLLGGAALADPSVSQAIAADALGGASVADPQLLALVAVDALGGVVLADPELSTFYAIAPDALGAASLEDPALSTSSEMALLGGAQVFDPQIQVAVSLITPDVLGTASLPALQLNQAIVIDVLGGAQLPAIVANPGAYTLLPDALGVASVGTPTATVGAISAGPFAALGTASVATPGFLMAVVVPVLGGSTVAAPALAYNIALGALGTATAPAPTAQAGSIQTGPFARLGGSVLKDMVIFTGYEYGPPPTIVGGQTSRPTLSGDGRGPRLTTRKRTPELV